MSGKGELGTVLVLVGALSLSCATQGGPSVSIQPPQDPPAPTVELEFRGFETDRPDSVKVLYSAKLHNPRGLPMRLGRLEGSAFLAGLSADGLLPVVSPEQTLPVVLAPGSSLSVPLVLVLDSDTLSRGLASGNEEHRLRLDLAVDFPDEGISLSAFSELAFPKIREPVLTITEIVVKRAELINTRFVVALRIENPNPFPVQFSALAYELYGEGRFWAGGTHSDILSVPAGASVERRLHLVMNFIDMGRQLLNQIIALREVRYRFAGTATVGTGVEYLPVFVMSFDKSGNSRVIE